MATPALELRTPIQQRLAKGTGTSGNRNLPKCKELIKLLEGQKESMAIRDPTATCGLRLEIANVRPSLEGIIILGC